MAETLVAISPRIYLLPQDHVLLWPMAMNRSEGVTSGMKHWRSGVQPYSHLLVAVVEEARSFRWYRCKVVETVSQGL